MSNGARAMFYEGSPLVLGEFYAGSASGPGLVIDSETELGLNRDVIREETQTLVLTFFDGEVDEAAFVELALRVSYRGAVLFDALYTDAGELEQLLDDGLIVLGTIVRDELPPFRRGELLFGLSYTSNGGGGGLGTGFALGFAAIPEPSTCLLVALGLAAVAHSRRRAARSAGAT
jgi:hypothetical protein